MGIMATVYNEDNQIIVEESKWTGSITVKYNSNIVSSKNYAFSRTHSFYVSENGQQAHYEVTLTFPYPGRKVTIARNGIIIFSQKDGFVPPPTRKAQSSPIQQKEVITKEIILVVCPNCAHRNDSSRRTCENCGASI